MDNFTEYFANEKKEKLERFRHLNRYVKKGRYYLQDHP